MITSDFSLEPDWDEDNIEHLARHGLKPEQIEEVYYGEGPYPTLALKNKTGDRLELRYRLWGCDAGGSFIEAIIAPYPDCGVWRCVTAFPLTPVKKRLYLQRVKKL